MGNVSTKDLHGSRSRKNVHWKSAEHPSPPGKPLMISDVEGCNVTMCWVPPRSDGGAPITGYIVEQRITGSPHWTRAIPAIVVQPEVTPQGLEPGKRYQFRVAAANATGYSEFSEPSEPLTVTVGGAVCAPAFLAELRDATVAESERAEFEARVIGVPTPTVAWFKDGFEIFSSRRARIATEENRSVLTIHQTSLNDEGEIKCTATNHAGHAVTRARLRVEAPPGVRLPRRYEEGLLFEAGELMKLKVAVAGRPDPRITWTHDGETIISGGRAEIEQGGMGIRIKNASRSDRGEYRVHAINPLGEDSAAFLVTVTDKPRPPSKPIVTMSLGKSATLTWQEPEDDGGCKIGNYIVEYFRTGWDVWLKAAASRQLTATLGDLLEGSEYRFRVKAENPYGLSEPSVPSEPLFIPDPSRGITRVQEIKIPSELETPPVAPKRKRAPASASSSKSSLSDEKGSQTPINSETKVITTPKVPVADAGVRDVINTNVFDRSSVTRELSYGSPDIVYKKRHSANLNEEDHVEERKKSTSPVPQKQQTNENSLSPKVIREPSSPRENDDELQGSSEFMLVLYPDKSEGLQSRDEFEEEDYGAPPLLSLSNPELGTRPPEAPLLRYAVSSTELLYERAMARFYRAAEREKNRELLKTGSEPQNLTDLQRKGSLRRRPSGAEHQKLLQMQERRLSLKLGDDIELRSSPTPKVITGIVFNGVVEDSEEPTDNDIKEVEGNKRFVRDHSVEEDYTESTASSDSESQDERFKLLFKKIKTLDDDEEDTYHPRSMLPTNTNSQAAEVLNKLAPLPDPDYVPKPILKQQPNDSINKSKIPPAKPERKSLISKPQTETLPQINIVPPEEKKIMKPSLDQKRKLEQRQKSEEENKVVIDHYADLVRQISTSKKQTDSKDIQENKPVERNFDNPKGPSEYKQKDVQEIEIKNRISSKSPTRMPRTSSKDRKSRTEVRERDSIRKPAVREVSKDKINVKDNRTNSKDRNNVKSRGHSRERAPSRERTSDKRVSRYEESNIKLRNRSESKSPTRQITNKTITTNNKLRNTSRTRKRSESRSPTRQMEVMYQNTSVHNERWQAKTEVVSKAAAEANVRTAFAYVTDLSMFLLACWLYIFKDPRLAIPILALMVYRQLGEELQKRMPQWIIKKWQK